MVAVPLKLVPATGLALKELLLQASAETEAVLVPPPPPVPLSDFEQAVAKKMIPSTGRMRFKTFIMLVGFSYLSVVGFIAGEAVVLPVRRAPWFHRVVVVAFCRVPPLFQVVAYSGVFRAPR